MYVCVCLSICLGYVMSSSLGEGRKGSREGPWLLVCLLFCSVSGFGVVNSSDNSTLPRYDAGRHPSMSFKAVISSAGYVASQPAS
ncbi:hypothetical protein F5Y09DRAFT_310920 [Xylaria sp. FL1042]|nr:hypothetical protein F5Y09DRAFT_310920 [Xylaria sp. FL1042]